MAGGDRGDGSGPLWSLSVVQILGLGRVAGERRGGRERVAMEGTRRFEHARGLEYPRFVEKPELNLEVRRHALHLSIEAVGLVEFGCWCEADWKVSDTAW